MWRSIAIYLAVMMAGAGAGALIMGLLSGGKICQLTKQAVFYKKKSDDLSEIVSVMAVGQQTDL